MTMIVLTFHSQPSHIDSWSSASSREGNLPQADLTTWTNNEVDDEASNRSPDASVDVSSSLMEEPGTFAVTGNECLNSTSAFHVPLTAPKKPSTTTVNSPKAKGRVAFSESQMNVLIQRFSVQRYLPPAEMKNLAGVTGLTYKQVRDLRMPLVHKHSKIEYPEHSVILYISFFEG